jgi:hypothetical protein
MGHVVVSFHNICKIIATQQRIKDESKVKVLITNLRSKLCSMIDAYIADIDKSVNEIDQDLSSMLEVFNNENVSQEAYNAIVKTVWENSFKDVQEILENVLMLGKSKKEKFESECINLIRCMPFPKSLVMKQAAEKPKSKSLSSSATLLHKYLPQNNIICIQRPNSQTTSVVYLESELPQFCDTIMVNNTVYVAGGKSLNKFTNKTFKIKIDDDRGSLIELCQMGQAKALHTLCKHKETHFLAIGGFNSIALNIAEVYSIMKGKWYKLPLLNECRYNSAVCVFNQDWVYVIGGCTKVCCSNTVERLQISNQTKWELIVPIDEHSILPRQNAYSIQTSPNTILIFGGILNNNLTETAELVISAGSHKIKSKQGVKLDQFFASSGVELIDDVVYAFSKDGKSFSYSIKDSEWSFMRIELSEDNL